MLLLQEFSEVDLNGAIGRIRIFRDKQSIRDLIDRTPTKLDSAAKNALEYAFGIGRGGLYLTLSADQYRRLKFGR